MKIILVALIAAVASARRPPRGFDIDYSDSPTFFDSPPPPPPPPPPSSSRLSYLRPYSSRHQSYPSRVFKSFSSDDRSIISDLPPSYRGEKIIYDSLPPSSYYPRRPHSFYKSGPSSFAQELSFAQEYRGPPPPAPASDVDSRKQTSVTGDERPAAGASALLQLQQTTMADEQNSHKSAEQPIRLEIPTRQPLSFGGHSNHLSYGNHGLGFASVAGATLAHLDPLAIAEMQATGGSSAATTTSPSSPSEVQVSQQQAVTNTPKPMERPTSAQAKFIPTATQPSTINTASSSSDSASKASSTASSTTTTTTVAMTSVTPKTHLDLARNSPSQTTKALPMKLQETPRLSYEFRAVMQELPAATHGQLPLESSRPEPSHVLDIKQNLLQEENKANFPYQQFDYQFHQQNNNNAAAAPLRFTIPTATISTSPLSASTATGSTTTTTTMILPVKSVTQGLSLPQTPLALAAVPNSNTYTLGQNQIDLSQLGKISSINIAPQLPSFYYAQNAEQMKTTPQISSTNIPLASFYMLPNNIQPRQPVQINTAAQSGIPLQFNGFGGIELLTSSSNAEPVRSDILGLARAGFLQGPMQSPESAFTRIGFGQNIW